MSILRRNDHQRVLELENRVKHQADELKNLTKTLKGEVAKTRGLNELANSLGSRIMALRTWVLVHGTDPDTVDHIPDRLEEAQKAAQKALREEKRLRAAGELTVTQPGFVGPPMQPARKPWDN
jgi:hypothetical protein